jgi:FMN phosphatase YigB (HAD superfamily)
LSLLVFLDLDGTLLINDMSAFQKVYLPLLSKSIFELPKQKVINQILAATEAMVKKNRPETTLENTFDKNFYPALGVTKSDLSEKVHYFYCEIFPTLKSLTIPQPNAVSLVNCLFDEGHQVIIATSPLFPSIATFQRLEWANLSVQDFNFSLVTTYETFHFAKPNPAYYAEILAQLGWPENNAVMVGNSFVEDIIPAEYLGLPTYWLNGSNDLKGFPRNHFSNSGNFDGIIPWLNKISIELPLSDEVCPIGAYVPILSATPAAIDTFYQKYPGKQVILNHLSSSLCEIDVTHNLPIVYSTLSSQYVEEYLQSALQDFFPYNIENFIHVRSKIIGFLENSSINHWQDIPINDQKFDSHMMLLEFIRSIVENDRKSLRDVYLSMQ